MVKDIRNLDNKQMPFGGIAELEYKVKIGNLKKITFFRVNGKEVRDKYFIDFVEGGHWLVYNFIPENEIWLEEMADHEEEIPILIHEIYEVTLMQYTDKDYETSHDVASALELLIRNYDVPEPNGF